MQAVKRPVAAADDVAGAGGGEATCAPRSAVEEGAAVGAGDQFGAALAGAVGVVAAHGSFSR